MSRAGIWVLVLLPLLPLPQENEKEAARENIQGYLEASDWKRAAKALKSYIRKHVLTEEEEQEARASLDRAEGFYEFEKIQKEFQKKERVRNSAEKVADLLEEYGQVPDLRAQAEEYLGGLRSRYVLSLESFENWEDKDAVTATGLQLESDPEYVKRGRGAGRWTSPGGGAITVPIRQEDWSEYAYFCLWIYNEKLDRKRPTHIEVMVGSVDGRGCFITHFAIDWTGWKEVRKLMITRKTEFSKAGGAEWNAVTRLTLQHDDTHRLPFDIVLDDIRLEKAVK